MLIYATTQCCVLVFGPCGAEMNVYKKGFNVPSAQNRLYRNKRCSLIIKRLRLVSYRQLQHGEVAHAYVPCPYTCPSTGSSIFSITQCSKCQKVGLNKFFFKFIG